MGQNHRRERLLKVLVALILFSLVFSAAEIFIPEFPVAADNAASEVFGFLGKEKESSFFAESAAVLKKAMGSAEYFFERIKENLSGKKEETPKITGRLFTCAAANPLGEYSEITSAFGERFFEGENEHHGGIDFAAQEGEDVFPAWPGKVLSIGYDAIYGNFVVLEHGKNLSTRYCHLSEIFVEVGEKILPEKAVGRVGTTGRSTGSHLHFEILFQGAGIDPKECLVL